MCDHRIVCVLVCTSLSSDGGRGLTLPQLTLGEGKVHPGEVVFLSYVTEM